MAGAPAVDAGFARLPNENPIGAAAAGAEANC